MYLYGISNCNDLILREIDINVTASDDQPFHKFAKRGRYHGGPVQQAACLWLGNELMNAEPASGDRLALPDRFILGNLINLGFYFALPSSLPSLTARLWISLTVKPRSQLEDYFTRLLEHNSVHYMQRCLDPEN